MLIIVIFILLGYFVNNNMGLKLWFSGIVGLNFIQLPQN